MTQRIEGDAAKLERIRSFLVELRDRLGFYQKGLTPGMVERFSSGIGVVLNETSDDAQPSCAEGRYPPLGWESVEVVPKSLDTGLKRLTLVGSGALACALDREFSDVDLVDVVDGDALSFEADAMVCPTNSFGTMDESLSDAFGKVARDNIRHIVTKDHHGEMPVGFAHVTLTRHKRLPRIVVTPTSRVSEPTSGTLNAYLSFRAVLLAVRRHNEEFGGDVKTLVVPELCVDGGMSPECCAKQMRVAFDGVCNPIQRRPLDQLRDAHQRMIAS